MMHFLIHNDYDKIHIIFFFKYTKSNVLNLFKNIVNLNTPFRISGNF